MIRPGSDHRIDAHDIPKQHKPRRYAIRLYWWNGRVQSHKLVRIGTIDNTPGVEIIEVEEVWPKGDKCQEYDDSEPILFKRKIDNEQ